MEPMGVADRIGTTIEPIGVACGVGTVVEVCIGTATEVVTGVARLPRGDAEGGPGGGGATEAVPDAIGKATDAVPRGETLTELPSVTRGL